MALTAIFGTGGLCRLGGRHFELSVSVGPRTVKLAAGVDDLLEPVSPEDLKAALLILARRMVQELADKSPGNIRSKLNGFTLTMTL